MKQLLILSGKGGTGKTTLASAFIKSEKLRAYADCDVDAPNLHLVMEQESEAKRTDYYGLDKAEIDPEKCVPCDLCRRNCRFDAITVIEQYKIDYFACEGCGVCEEICPSHAIRLKPAIAGELILHTGKSVFSTAQLKMGSGNSGLLVTEVKKQLKQFAPEVDYAVIDGSPGIGCPVIASLSGVDMVLIVTEPSISGISDMERIIETAKKFQTKIAICINKFDTNRENTKRIEAFCVKNHFPLVGKIPFDKEAVKAINNGHSITDINCAAGQAAKELIKKTTKILLDKN